MLYLAMGLRHALHSEYGRDSAMQNKVAVGVLEHLLQNRIPPYDHSKRVFLTFV